MSWFEKTWCAPCSCADEMSEVARRPRWKRRGLSEYGRSTEKADEPVLAERPVCYDPGFDKRHLSRVRDLRLLRASLAAELSLEKTEGVDSLTASLATLKTLHDKLAYLEARCASFEDAAKDTPRQQHRSHDPLSHERHGSASPRRQASSPRHQQANSSDMTQRYAAILPVAMSKAPHWAASTLTSAFNSPQSSTDCCSSKVSPRRDYRLVPEATPLTLRRNHVNDAMTGAGCIVHDA